MPGTIDIRTKRKAFPGGPDMWNAIVHGPAEAMDGLKGLSSFLVRHGFSSMPGGGDRTIWATLPAAVAPSHYLGPLLAARYGVRATRETQAVVSEAIQAREPEDSLDRFIGKRALATGARALTVRAGRRVFIANCDADHHTRQRFLEGAGWLPVEASRVTPALRDKFGSAPYMTADPFIASNLSPFMTREARALLSELAGHAKKAIAASRSQEAPDGFDVPAPEGLDYLPFQKGGIASITRSPHSGIIADDMGLGKTIQGMGVINATPEATSILVTCQANMKLKWVREITKWRVNQALTVDYAEGDRLPDTDIVVINYDIIDRHKESLRDRKWDIMLLDEGHNLKNAEAIRTLAILGDVITLDPEKPQIGVSAQGKRLFLTGTPKPNKITDLWPLLTATRPDIWGRGPAAYRAFVDRYQPEKPFRKTIRKGRSEYQVIIPRAGEPQRELELQLRMRGSGSFIRRMKRDTDLPPKFRTPLELPFRFSEEDRRALAEIDANIEALAERVAIENGQIRIGERLPAGSVIDVIRGLAPNSPHFSEGARVRANLGLLKAPYMARFIAEELLAENDMAPELRRKTVVFAHHKAVIATMAEIIRREFPDGVLVYDGSISSPKKKQALVDRFESDPEARVFLMSKAGNSGITLTAAHRMRVAEPDWDPANMAQVEDRIWRIGQMQPCDIGYFYAPGSYDLNIGEGLINKMDTDERTLNSFVLTGKSKGKRGSAHDALFSGPDARGAQANQSETIDADQDAMQMRLPL